MVSSPSIKSITSGESESSYLTRITSTLKPTIRDAHGHLNAPGSSANYIQTDDTHPTYVGDVVKGGLGGGSTGTGAPRYSTNTGGKNPIWNTYGHERMGWLLSSRAPAAP